MQVPTTQPYPWLNFDTHLSRSKLDEITYTFDMLFDKSVYLFTPFHTQCVLHISCNLDMISYHQSFWIHFWVYQSVLAKLYQKWIKTRSRTRCPILIGSKVYQSSARDCKASTIINSNRIIILHCHLPPINDHYKKQLRFRLST